MFDPTPKIRALAEAELLRVELEARRAGQRAAWYGFAILVVAVGLVMLIVAAYAALAQLYGPTWGALMTAGGSFALALTALLIARKPPGRTETLEMQLAEQKIAMARAEIKRDIDEVERKFDDLAAAMTSIFRGAAAKHPTLSGVLGVIAALAPLLRMFIRR